MSKNLIVPRPPERRTNPLDNQSPDSSLLIPSSLHGGLTINNRRRSPQETGSSDKTAVTQEKNINNNPFAIHGRYIYISAVYQQAPSLSLASAKSFSRGNKLGERGCSTNRVVV